MRAADEGGSIIQAQLVVSPDGGLATAIGNNLASTVAEGEARQHKPQTYAQIQHCRAPTPDQGSQRKLGRKKIKIGKKGLRSGHIPPMRLARSKRPMRVITHACYLPTISWARATNAGEAA